MSGGGEKTILLVEDEAVIALKERKVLQAAGYTVILADSGEKAVEAAAGGRRPDLVLMDINLGAGIDGTEAARRILALNSLPIVFLTSHAEREMVEKVRGITRYGYVIKSSGDFVLRSSIEMAFELFEANQRLAESEARHRSLFENAPLGVFYSTIPGKIVRVNDEYARIMGYASPEELKEIVNRKVTSEVIFDRPEERARLMDAALAEPGRWIKTRQGYRRKDGSHIVTNLYFRALPDSPGMLEGFLEDISERLRVEELLGTEKERLRSVIDATNAGTWEWNIQTGDTVIDGKSAALLGFALDDLKPLAFETWMNLKHPEDMRLSRESLERHLRGETEFYSFESRMRHRDGSWVWVLGRGSVVERDAAGRPLRMYGIHMDINERKKAEEALRTKSEELDRFFGLALDLLCIADTGGRFLRLNPEWERVLGYSLPELEGRSFLELVHPDDLDATLAAIGRLEAQERVLSFENRYRRKDGSYRWIEWRSHPRGGLIYAAARDITERKLSEERVKGLLAEKELVLKELHHRIKNNMATVTSLLALQAGSLGDSDAAAVLVEAGNRLNCMSLLYDKLYRSPDFEALPVRDYLPGLVDEILSGFSGGAAVRVEKSVDDFVLGAAVLQPLGIIVNELLTNIMKYAFAGRNGGRVRLSAGIEGDRVTVAVEDDGVGMPQTVDFGKSTGFGLTLVEALTEQLGGQVRIERDMGTRIVLQFDR